MAVLKRIWAVILATGVGGILGIVFDWLKQNGSIPVEPGTEYAMLYPWVAGGGALIGSILALLVIRDRKQTTQQSPAPNRKKSKQAARNKPAERQVAKPALKGGSEIKSADLNAIKLDHVDGMPGFDFDPDSTDKTTQKQQ